MVPGGVIETEVTFLMGFAATQLLRAFLSVFAHFGAVDSRMKIQLLLSVSVLARSPCLALWIFAVVGLIHDLVGEGIPSENGDFGPVGLETERAE